MPPSPSREELIATVRADSPSDDPLAELAQASVLVQDLEDVGDYVLNHFVNRCRTSGHSWSEISAALGVSKQAAHKRYAAPPVASFSRFTPRAQAVLQAAIDEAAGLNHGFVGTEHLLLAQFSSPESIAAKVLASAGLTREAVSQALGLKPGANPPKPGAGATPFTPRALDVLRNALTEALHFGHNYVGTEHLLLASFADPESLSARVLQALGLTYEHAKANIEQELALFKK